MRRTLTCLFLLQAGALFAAEPSQLRTDGPHFVGAAGCKSSSCHGAAGEKRSQYFTWAQKDFHTRGYAILTDARSQRIAAGVGITAAETSSRCTICHSPFQVIAASRLASDVDPHESVSCENCHGAAESWLRGHTRKDWSYATRVGAGMRDLKSFYVRANTCVACHQNLDNDIAAAGHPEMFFELDSQSANEPKHWRDPDGSGARAWLVGQAVALRELSWKLTKDTSPDTITQMQWNALAWLLHEVTSAEGMLVSIDASLPYGEMQTRADTLARRAAQQNLHGDVAERVARALIATDQQFANVGEPNELSFHRAQRLVLALERLMQPDKIRALRNDLRTPYDFNAIQFATDLRKLSER